MDEDFSRVPYVEFERGDSVASAYCFTSGWIVFHRVLASTFYRPYALRGMFTEKLLCSVELCSNPERIPNSRGSLLSRHPLTNQIAIVSGSPRSLLQGEQFIQPSAHRQRLRRREDDEKQRHD